MEGLVHKDLSMQVIRQAEVMLKSAVLFTKKRLHFHVIADSKKLFGRLVNQTAGWPDGFKKKIRFTIQEGSLPRVKSLFIK